MRVMAAWLKFLCLVAALCCGLVAAAQAVDPNTATAPPSDPPAIPNSSPEQARDYRPPSDAPALPDNPLPGTPAPAPAAAASDAASDLQACLQETGDYVTRGSSVVYVIAIANSCEKKLRCEVFANISGSRGTSLGHTVMTLAPASGGTAAKKTYEMHVKTAGGIAQISRECRVL